MEQFQLPLLSDTQSLSDAINKMRSLNVRAFVLQVGNTYRLIRNRELRDAWVAGAQNLGELRQHGLELPAQYGRELPALKAAVAEVGGSSTESEPAIRILDSLSPQVLLLESAHERIADLYLRTSKVCICDHNQQHSCDSPPGIDGKPCDMGDGTYKCF